LLFLAGILRSKSDKEMTMTPTLDSVSAKQADHARPDGVSIQSLNTGTEVLVQTQNSTYHLVVLDPENRRVRVTGGRLFRNETDAVIEGATAGACVLKVGWIGVGLRLEICEGDQRARTSTVDAISIANTDHFR
jgi:hypothetical protein